MVKLYVKLIKKSAAPEYRLDAQFFGESGQNVDHPIILNRETYLLKI